MGRHFYERYLSVSAVGKKWSNPGHAGRRRTVEVKRRSGMEEVEGYKARSSSLGTKVVFEDFDEDLKGRTEEQGEHDDQMAWHSDAICQDEEVQVAEGDMLLDEKDELDDGGDLGLQAMSIHESSHEDSASEHDSLYDAALRDTKDYEHSITSRTENSRSSKVPKPEDMTFWGTSAVLLGPDFGFNAITLREQTRGFARNRWRESAKTLVATDQLVRMSTSSSSFNSSTLIPEEYKHLHDSLESLGTSWLWFETSSALQNFIDTSVPENKSWNFGVCFQDYDGSRCCAIMRARGRKRTYAPPPMDGNEDGMQAPDAGCMPVFWWCRPTPLCPALDPRLRAREVEMEFLYEKTKRRITSFQVKDDSWGRAEMARIYTQLVLDLTESERLTGRFSFKSMNTLLLLGDIAELLEKFPDAEQWNWDLVVRRNRRLGQTSMESCQARYKLAGLLFKMGSYDSARDVVRENLGYLSELPTSDHLLIKQNIQSCVVAMKRRRVEQALEIVEHIWSLERWHRDDAESMNEALLIAIQAHSFRHEYAEAETYLRKRIELNDKGGYGNGKVRATCHLDLASCLHKQGQNVPATQSLHACIVILKEHNLAEKEITFDAYELMGLVLYDMKEWNKAKFHLGKAVKGFESCLGKKNEKYKKAREMMEKLEKSMRVKQGLAERLAQQKEREKMKKKF